MTTCERLEELRDYAMGEGGRSARDAMEKHVAACGDCAAELRSLQFTTAALRMAPDREVPQRIAFVSDKVFEPSYGSKLAAKWFGGFWNSAARLGFASAVVLAAAFVIVAYRPGASGPGQQIVIPASVSKADVDRAVNEAVSKAVAQVRREDTAVLAASEEKHEQEHKALMVTMGENMDYLQRRMNTGMMLASADQERPGSTR